MIAVRMMSSFDLPNILSLFQTSFDIDKAFLVPTSCKLDLMRRISKITRG